MIAKMSAFIVVSILVLGFLCPMLISYPDTLWTSVGFAILGAYIIACVYLIKHWWVKITTKTLMLICMCLIPMMFSSGCSKVPAGYRGVKVYLLGGDKGVEAEELGVGRYWIGINEELYLFPTFTQNYVWTRDKNEGSESDESITFQTKEGLTVNADVGISYSIRPDRVASIFQKYRKGIDEITDVYLRNMVRDAFNSSASTKPVEYVYGKGKSDMLSEVEVAVRDQVEELGINIERVYFIGSLRLPDTVIGALNRKIEATQRAEQRENELREAEAEAKKRVAQAKGEAQAIQVKAEAQAQANLIIARSLTAELVKYQAINKWNGQLPYLMGGEGVVPMIQMGSK